MAVVAELVFNWVVESLSPQEYDGATHITLPRNDKRLRVGALLQWERDNAVRAVEQALVPAASFFTSLKARDKVGRLIQFMCRLLQGFLERSSDQRKRAMLPVIKKLVLTISDARRMFRVVEVGPLLMLARGLSTVSTVYDGDPFWGHALGAMACAALFNLTDRWRWLQEHQLVSGNYRATGRMAMRALCACHALQCLRHLLHATRMYLELRTEKGHGNGQSVDALTERREAMRACMAHVFKQLSCFIQAAHMGKLPYLQSSDIMVSVLGVATTVSDLRDLWRSRGR